MEYKAKNIDLVEGYIVELFKSQCSISFTDLCNYVSHINQLDLISICNRLCSSGIVYRDDHNTYHILNRDNDPHVNVRLQSRKIIADTEKDAEIINDLIDYWQDELLKINNHVQYFLSAINKSSYYDKLKIACTDDKIRSVTEKLSTINSTDPSFQEHINTLDILITEKNKLVSNYNIYQKNISTLKILFELRKRVTEKISIFSDALSSSNKIEIPIS